jgi:hypothetical protein
MWEWRYSFTILNLSSRWRLVVSFTSRPLYPGETATGTRWMGGWVGSRAGLDVVEKRKSVASARNISPALQHVVRHYTEGYAKKCIGNILISLRLTFLIL